MQPQDITNPEQRKSRKFFDSLFAKVRYILTQLGRLANMHDKIQAKLSMAQISD